MPAKFTGVSSFMKNHMNKKDVFYRDKEACRVPLTHIMEGATESPLKELDELYGAADVLSIQNAKKHRRILLALSAAGTFLTLAFLLYDEAEPHGLIIACGAMILCLFFIRHTANRLDCHRKHLEYRVLAECLRCQFFPLIRRDKNTDPGSAAMVCTHGDPWIPEVLLSVPADATSENNSILVPWIIEQKKYHKKALENTVIENRRDGECRSDSCLVENRFRNDVGCHAVHGKLLRKDVTFQCH